MGTCHSCGKQVEESVLVLEADDEVIVRRLGGRRSCPVDGAVYNVYTNPPAKEGRCDRCGSELVHREDDKPETIRRRLQVYRAQTEPLIRYYQTTPARVVFVDGDRAPDEVQAAIRKAVDGQSA